MNTYYLRKFRKKAKEFTRIQCYKGHYVVELKENIGVGYTLWHWSIVKSLIRTLKEAQLERKAVGKALIIKPEIEKVKNKRLAKL